MTLSPGNQVGEAGRWPADRARGAGSRRRGPAAQPSPPASHPLVSRVSALLLTVLVAGCGDRLYVVRTSGTLPATLDISCIGKALASDPDGANARLVGPGFTVPRVEPEPGDPVTYDWHYGELGQSTIRIRREPGHWAFENSRSYLGDGAALHGMFRFKPVMQRVNALLEARCGLKILEHYELGI